MKHKTISTDKATLLVVEMPEGVNEYHHSRAGVSLSQGDGSYLFISGNWQILGRLPDITEEQAENVVEVSVEGFECWDYLKKDWGAFGFSPTESLESLLQANEVYFENHLGEEPVIDEYFCGKKDFDDSDIEIFKNIHQQWVKAQKQFWDKARTHLFIKKK